MSCTRSITFVIPGTSGGPDVQVYAEEGTGGTLVFTVTVLSTPTLTADLRGLFFNVNENGKLAGMAVSQVGNKVTDFDTHDVIDLGNGANMQGKAKPFDVGLEFGTQGIGKDDIQTATFTLSNAAGDLTLDDIAQVEFGARLTSIGAPGGARSGSSKSTFIAPAAPDANDDTYDTLFEDGASGLNDPRKTPQGILLHVLANDTDADGDKLTVTGFDGLPLHGTVQIVDGDDADDLIGDAILYTPDLDYAGTDSFVYCITDSNGGTDFATVNLTLAAVADVPLLSYEVLAGATVNQIILRVTATQNDEDSSEYIDRILLSVEGGVPAGSSIVPGSVNPAGQPDQIVQDFLINLPLNQDTSFTVDITAWSKETSNGDEEKATTSLDIVYEYNRNDFDTTFYAIDQSIWGTGDQFTFEDDRFLGIDESWNQKAGDFAFAQANGYLKTGFQSTLTFEGGEIDAEVPYDIFVDTNYNKTTDVLKISSGATLLSGGGFTTEGPEGSYNLDFIFDFFLNASAGLDFGDLGTLDLISITLGPIDATLPILDIDSDDLTFTVNLPAGFSLTFAWPDIETTSDATNVYNASGASNDFFELGLDIDDLITAILGLPVNPFAPGFDIGVAWGQLEIIDLDIGLGLNFLQQFELAVTSLAGTIIYENGDTDAFVFGTDIILTDASSYDADNDDLVEFELVLDPQATLSNSTDLGFNFLWNFDILRLSGGYSVFGFEGEFSVGPAVDLGGVIPIGDVEVYNDTFALNFQSYNYGFAA